ncbi:hypothetical protein N9W79_01185 [bacterium]|nr:hypothetical protein [bacterium]
MMFSVFKRWSSAPSSLIVAAALIFSGSTVSTSSTAQVDAIKSSAADAKDSAASELDKAKRKYNKSKKNLKKKTSGKKTQKGKKVRKNLLEVAKEAAINNLFPSWPVPKFDWGLDPLAGFELRSYTSGGTTQEVATTELGLYGNMRGIPFDPNNPGFVGDVGIGGTFGAQAEGETESDGSTGDIDSLTYKRYWGSVGATFLYNQFKNKLTVRRGLIDASGDSPTISSSGITNDVGILFYSWISGHYTLNYDIVDISSQDETYLTETDHWFHTRMFTEFLNAYFDFGPGFTDSEQNVADVVNKQFTTYFLATTGMNPFWKLVAKARAKYVLDATDDTLSPLVNQLPDQALNEPVDTGIPSDSIVATAFMGFDNLWGGFGVGYQINLTIFNLNEKDGTVKSTTRQQGLTMAYTAHY